MAKKLYVGNLSYDTTEESLRAAFAEVGEVESVTIVTDRMSGRSRGFGFVDMATDAAAAEAISRLNGQMLDGRDISVAEARPPRDRGGGGRGPRGGGGGGRGSRGSGSRGGGGRGGPRSRDYD
jgi:cold-inducible RNA-binding protein